MNEFLSRALGMKEEIVRNRRAIHRFGGVGLDLPETTAYVMERLREMGLEPVEICRSGVVCCVGGKRPGKTILLRADMDALPIEEKTGLPLPVPTAPCTPAGTTCTRPCCWAPPGC